MTRRSAGEASRRGRGVHVDIEGDRERRSHWLAGLAAAALLLALLAASFIVGRFAAGEADVREGLRLVESGEAKERLLGLAKLRGDPRAASVFAGLLDDPDPRVRTAAALMLAGCPGAPELPDGTDPVGLMRDWWERAGRAAHGGEEGPAD